METLFSHSFSERRSMISRSRTPVVKWFKEWVPQDVVATGGKCQILRWVNESTSKVLKEKTNEPEAPEPEPEPTTEILFLCTYEGCGKTFIDAGALKKHSHIHGERQFVCHYEGCGKKFLDSSKLKRHFLIHTGERDFVCPHEGCGKAFSLDFNLRSHMKTHSQENYHICPYQECGKRYAHEIKLKNHIASHHEKNAPMEPTKYSTPPERISRTSKPPTNASGSSATSNRRIACPYEGCEKTYVYEYKLALHLDKHPDHVAGEKNNHDGNNATTPNPDNNDMDEGSDQDAVAYGRKRVVMNGKTQKQQSRLKPNLKMPPSKRTQRKVSSPAPITTLNVVKKPWIAKEDVYEEDSEETEEDRDNVEDGYNRYGQNNDDDDDDDEETEDED